jgi:hypothetical protein
LSQGRLRIAIYTHQQFRVAATATPPKHLVMLLFDKMHVFAARFCSSIALMKTATADQIAYQHGPAPDCLLSLPFVAAAQALQNCRLSATESQAGRHNMTARAILQAAGY